MYDFQAVRRDTESLVPGTEIARRLIQREFREKQMPVFSFEDDRASIREPTDGFEMRSTLNSCNLPCAAAIDRNHRQNLRRIYRSWVFAPREREILPIA